VPRMPTVIVRGPPLQKRARLRPHRGQPGGRSGSREPGPGRTQAP
jgi:hypothetical protein